MTRVFVTRLGGVGDKVRVEGDEYAYMAKVRRVRSGGVLEVICPDGRRFSGTVTKLGNGFADVRIDEALPQAPAPWPVHLAVAVPKKNLFDDIVRQLSELGVQRLTPLTTERSVLVPGDGRLVRWRRIASESRRQCGRREPIVVDDIGELGELEAGETGLGKRVIMSPGVPGRGLGAALLGCASPVTIVVGPEGGFTSEEIQGAISAGFEPVTMGQFVLRVETAAVAAACVCIASQGGY